LSGREPMETRIADYLHELGQLKRVQRSGWWLAGVRCAESVAEHSFRAAAIAFVLADLEGADPAKAATLALFHDAAETRVNDAHRMARRYIDWRGVEEKVVDDQLLGLPADLARRIQTLYAESRSKATLEACIAKDADLLECLLQGREYEREGLRVEDWIESSVSELTTRSGRRLARAILETSPDAWRSPPSGPPAST